MLRTTIPPIAMISIIASHQMNSEVTDENENDTKTLHK
jgi:hypothetical protein